MEDRAVDFFSASCLICGIRGRGNRDFVCGDCGHPDKIILNCVNCRSRFDLSPEELEKLKKLSPKVLTIDETRGIAIKAGFCFDCALEEGTTNLKFFKIR